MRRSIYHRLIKAGHRDLAKSFLCVADDSFGKWKSFMEEMLSDAGLVSKGLTEPSEGTLPGNVGRITRSYLPPRGESLERIVEALEDQSDPEAQKHLEHYQKELDAHNKVMGLIDTKVFRTPLQFFDPLGGRKQHSIDRTDWGPHGRG